MKTVWVVISDGHMLDNPAVNVVTSEAHAMRLVREMWDIWTSDNGLPSDTPFPDPNAAHQGVSYIFEEKDVYWENTEWHYVYEVEVAE